MSPSPQHRPLAAALDYIVSRAIPYAPESGMQGYEWVTDNVVAIHPDAKAALDAGLAAEVAERARLKALWGETEDAVFDGHQGVATRSRAWSRFDPSPLPA